MLVRQGVLRSSIGVEEDVAILQILHVGAVLQMLLEGITALNGRYGRFVHFASFLTFVGHVELVLDLREVRQEITVVPVRSRAFVWNGIGGVCQLGTKPLTATADRLIAYLASAARRHFPAKLQARPPLRRCVEKASDTAFSWRSAGSGSTTSTSLPIAACIQLTSSLFSCSCSSAIMSTTQCGSLSVMETSCRV